MNKKTIKRNLEKVLWSATDKQHAAGINWYCQAHKQINALWKSIHTDIMIGQDILISYPQIIGVISALSPACRWDDNIIQAKNLIRAYLATKKVRDVVLTTYKNQIKKAMAILDLPIDCDLLDVANCLGKRAFKTKAFLTNIYHPEDKTYVTIDRHIYDAAKVICKSGNKSQYEMLSDCIKELAKKYDYIPNQLQAIIWLVWKNQDKTEVPF